MRLLADTFPTALGRFALAVDGAGAVAGAVFGDLEALDGSLGAGGLTRDPGAARGAREEVQAYLAGELATFSLAIAARGTPFQQRVWAALRAIPRGRTCGYGQLATSLGQPGAARAVGRANALNPVCLIVPCHRVISANGRLGGYAFGPALKARLLALEGVILPP